MTRYERKPFPGDDFDTKQKRKNYYSRNRYLKYYSRKCVRVDVKSKTIFPGRVVHNNILIIYTRDKNQFVSVRTSFRVL